MFVYTKNISLFIQKNEESKTEVDNKKDTQIEPPKADTKQLKVLSDDQVDVDIDPNVKSNDIKIQFCSCSIIFYCFSPR